MIDDSIDFAIFVVLDVTDVDDVPVFTQLDHFFTAHFPGFMIESEIHKLHPLFQLLGLLIEEFDKLVFLRFLHIDDPKLLSLLRFVH